MTPPTLRIIQVGLGGWGQSWAHDIVTPNQDIETVAWVEVDPGALAAAQKTLKFPLGYGFTSLDSALSTVEADAVLITASLPGHVPSAQIALNAGKHVLLEKPFAPSVAEAWQLVELAEQRERILMISQNYRFDPAVRKAAELVRAQTLGNVGNVNIDFRRLDNNPGNEPVALHRHYHIWQPLLVDMTIHHFDLMRYVLDQEPVQVYCRTWNPTWSNFDEDPAGTMTVTFSGGTVVNYRGSWVSRGSQTNWAGEWQMDCTGGEILWTSRGELPEQVQVHPLGKPVQSVALPELAARDRSGSLAAFVEAVRNGTVPETSGRNNIKTLEFMFAAIASAKSGLPVDLSGTKH